MGVLSETELLGVAREPPLRGVYPAREAGLYTVHDHVRSVNGAELLVTHFCGLSECGFAYSPDREPREVRSTYDHQRFEHLAGHWYAFVLDTAYEGDPC